jgi:hypothetical protein
VFGRRGGGGGGAAGGACNSGCFGTTEDSIVQYIFPKGELSCRLLDY